MGGPNRNGGGDYMGVSYPWERLSTDESRQAIENGYKELEEGPVGDIIDAEFCDPGVDGLGDEPPVKELPVWLL